MRILLHTEAITKKLGGATLTMLCFLEELRRRGHDVRIVARSSSTARLGAIPCYTADDLKQLKALYEWAEVLFIIRRAAVQPLREYRFWHEPHGSPPLFSVFFSHNVGQPYRYGYDERDLDLVVFNANWVREETQWPGKSLVIHPPIFKEDYLTTPGSAITLINLAQKKGGALFWQIAERLPHHQFLGVTSQDSGQIIPARLPKNVTLLNYTKDMRSIYGRTRVLLMPSQGYRNDTRWNGAHWTESYGRVGVEAALSGIPVIACPTPGIREALGDRALYCGDEPDEWVNTLLRLDDPQYYDERACIARTVVSEIDPLGDISHLERTIEEGIAARAAGSIGRAFFPVKPQIRPSAFPLKQQLRNKKKEKEKKEKKPAKISPPSVRTSASAFRRRNFKVLLGAILRWALITPIGLLMPRRKNLVVVMAPENGRFADNSKYSYLALSEDQTLDVRYCTFKAELAKEMVLAGINAFYYRSLAGAWTLLRAHVIVGVALYPFRYTLGHLGCGAIKVQLWHGAGVKNFGLKRPANVKRRESLYWRLRWRMQRMHPVFDYLYFPSEDMRSERSTAFRSKQTRLNGLVRNDVFLGATFGGRERLFTDEAAGSRIRELHRLGSKLVLFAPTFRKRGAPLFDELMKLELMDLDAFLRARQAFLVVKLHPHSEDDVRWDAFTSIFSYDRYSDIYPYLSYFTLYITDISSIFSDIALISTNIVHYIPDPKRLSRAAGVRTDVFQSLPGINVKTGKDLYSAIEAGLAGNLVPQGGRLTQSKTFHDFRDGCSSARLRRDIRAMVDHSPVAQSGDHDTVSSPSEGVIDNA